MGDPSKGTENILNNLECSSDWFLVREADCVDDINDIEELFDESTDESEVSNLIDDGDTVDEGNPLALFNKQLSEDCEKAISDLKRKYKKSPEQQIAALSPRLKAVSISPQKPSKRRLLFQDSGIQEDEAESATQVVPTEGDENVAGKDGAERDATNSSLLNLNNKRAHILFKFKELFGVAYSDLTRNYKSDRSCSDHWVILVHHAAEEAVEGSKIVLQQYCEYLQVITYDFTGLYLIQFKTAKNRDTVKKLICTNLNVSDWQVICDPPRTRSTPSALYFYQKGLGNASFKYGVLPDWIARQTLLSHQGATQADTFELAKMVQYAYDNDIVDESEMAYTYASCAEYDTNAAAFLKSNNQYKYLKDCIAMVRMYKRHEMRKMSMGQWVFKCCNEHSDTGDWKIIAKFLQYQQVQFISFLIKLKQFFKGIPKKNCMVFYGPPDTGKSFFCFSLLTFLHGKVISFMCKNSNFWLQPLLEAKIGFLDDATYPCWTFIDVNLRNALDGTPVCVDAKHKAPTQIRLPPLLITTNVPVLEDVNLKYLHSRLTCIEFPNKLPVSDDGSLVYQITNDTWASFFRKFASQLELVSEEEDDGGNSAIADTAFRCTAGSCAESV